MSEQTAEMASKIQLEAALVRAARAYLEYMRRNDSTMTFALPLASDFSDCVAVGNCAAISRLLGRA
jgi:hypothetical protein